ncbi:MAG: diaminobutyrate--2-oxoglutarate aminotransferase [Frankiales bacterium]|nr:diaminobutyrate--2-oxoglutarate aminotransferase [Frankiales bacterium]
MPPHLEVPVPVRVLDPAAPAAAPARAADVVPVQRLASREAAVRSYHAAYPKNFVSGRGSHLQDAQGARYLDFFCGAGAMNLGHNPPVVKAALVEHLQGDALLHGLDLETPAREGLRQALDGVLVPRGLDYKYLSPGPTGANAVEAALKIARRATGRRGVIAFTGAFHGMSLGALGVTANRQVREASGAALPDVTFFPFPDPRHPWTEHSLAHLEHVLDDTHSGVALPAAVIVESVQAEGGVNPAPLEWMAGLVALCRSRGVLVIADDIQVGCTRTGTFFSFDAAGVTPDIVVLAKALSGVGLPLSLVLFRPDLDVLGPGEHNGTFRGNQLAFAAAAVTLPLLADPALGGEVLAKGALMQDLLRDQVAAAGIDATVRGRGLILGVDLVDTGRDTASRVQRECFRRGLLVEAAGRHDTVVKMLPPLNVEHADLHEGADVFGQALQAVLASPS